MPKPFTAGPEHRYWATVIEGRRQRMIYHLYRSKRSADMGARGEPVVRVAVREVGPRRASIGSAMDLPVRA